ncbi:MAG: hypothetical protein AB7I37_04255 [Pirellulales bacterium]
MPHRCSSPRLLAAAVLLLAAASLLLAGPSLARGQDLAISSADIDLAACQALVDGTPQPVAIDDLLDVLGLSNKPEQAKSWSAGSVPYEHEPAVFEYLIVFKRPLAVGSILLRADSRQLFVAAPGVKPPFDMANAQAWTALDVPARQSGGVLFTLPVGFKTQAVKLVDRRSGRSGLECLWLFKARYQNVAPIGLAYARHEYTPPNSTNTQAASLLTAGTGAWASSGKDNNGQVSTPPITDINPEWFMLAWDEPQPISGLWLASNIVTWSLDTFVGPDDVNPRAGTDDEWKRVRKFEERTEAGGRRWIKFDAPLATRGLRLNILKTDPKSSQVATIDGLHALVDLKTQPPADLLAHGASGEPPFQFSYELKNEGKLTLVVNDEEGVRARNLVARAATAAGERTIGWNLKDERGEFVAPGRYRWSAIVVPELQTRYEFTVYPNIQQHAPENAPWLTGTNGSGGWLADHSPPNSVCAAGDRVYLGAQVAESGVSFIECDLEGRKTWGHHSFAAWTGPKLLASDGKTVFVGAQVLNESGDHVWGVDIKSREVRQVIEAKPSATRTRGLTGLAHRDGRLYMAVRGQEDWLVNAAAAEDVDLANCVPVYREARKARVAYEQVANPRNDFLRLFRLAPYPPGQGLQGGLTYLQSLKGSGQRQHIVLAFQRPVPLGSVAFPRSTEAGVRVVLSVLKPNAKYPPDADDEKQWIPFADEINAAWDVLAAPENTQTRALRVTFIKGEETDEDDLLANLGKDDAPAEDDEFVLDKKGSQNDALDGFGPTQGRWMGQLEGMKLLRRRFASAAEGAKVRVNSGTVNDDGTWDAQRTRPITPSDPGIYALQWNQPRQLRGLAIKEIDGRLTKVDVYTGPDRGDEIDIAGQDGWQEVAVYEQGRRDVANGYGGLAGVINPQARYVDGYVDFGREVETAAVRLRIVEQWADQGPGNCLGIRVDLGGGELDPTRCRVWGVAPLAYVGGEPVVDTRGHERIEVYDAASGKLIHEIALARPGQIAFSPQGDLFAISEQQIVKVPHHDSAVPSESSTDARPAKPFITDLEAPADLAFDADGNLYIFDGGPKRQNIRVYSPTGKYVRSIGQPGGFKAGAWVPERMGTVCDIDIDKRGQLWVVESQYWPKRITLWTTEGEFRKEFLGNTSYGGGGVLDPWDKTRLFYGPLEFALDWKTGSSRLKNLTWLPGWNAGEMPIRIQDRTYLVTRPQFSEMQCGIVYRYETDHIVLAAAMGPAMYFDPLKNEAFTKKLAGRPLSEVKFLWSDLNANGQVDVDEVQFSPKPQGMYGLTRFNDDLSVQSGAYRWEVKKYLDSGVPIYEEKHLTGLKDRVLYRLHDGNFHRLGDVGLTEAKLSPEGRELWTYVGEGTGVQALQNAGSYRPEQVISQFGIVGHATAPQGDLGEFVVIHGNTGGWNIWTADGLLVGPLFRDLRDPLAKPWSMSMHQRGMLLTNLNVGQEHFAGWVSRSLQDDKFYAVAGHNHASVVEILGLDQVRRYSGQIEVTAEDIARARAFDERQQQRSVYARSPVLDCYRVRQPPEIDGKLNDWPAPNAELANSAEFRMAYDDEFLFLAWSTRGLGPLKNTGQQWDRLFKSGAAVDLQLGLDPEAASDRQAPAEGDLRLLMTYMGDAPAAVLYRPIVAGAPAEKAWRVVSPVGEVAFDEVRRLERVYIAATREENSYTLEAAVPLDALGLHPADTRLKLDWGMLTTGPDGNEVLRRVYWANQATGTVADAPSEARLHPNLWGHVRLHAGVRPSAEDALDEIAIGGERKKAVKKDVKDILDELNDEQK